MDQQLACNEVDRSVISPGIHRWDYYPDTLSSLWSHCNWFKSGPPYWMTEYQSAMVTGATWPISGHQTGRTTAEHHKCQGDVSLTFHELSKIFSRNLYITKIVLLMRISSWKCARVPKAQILNINVISGIAYFREIILESSRNVNETTPRRLF